MGTSEKTLVNCICKRLRLLIFPHVTLMDQVLLKLCYVEVCTTCLPPIPAGELAGVQVSDPVSD